MEHYELYRDEELVQMYRDGDERAVEAIMERYKNFVSKKAHAMYIRRRDGRPYTGGHDRSV